MHFGSKWRLICNFCRCKGWWVFNNSILCSESTVAVTPDSQWDMASLTKVRSDAYYSEGLSLNHLICILEGFWNSRAGRSMNLKEWRDSIWPPWIPSSCGCSDSRWMYADYGNCSVYNDSIWSRKNWYTILLVSHNRFLTVLSSKLWTDGVKLIDESSWYSLELEILLKEFKEFLCLI